jgi:hypothetical protein
MPFFFAVLALLALTSVSAPAPKKVPRPGKGPMPADLESAVELADTVGEVAIPLVVTVLGGGPVVGVATSLAIRGSKKFLTPTEEAEALYGSPLGSVAAVGSAVARKLGAGWVP